MLIDALNMASFGGRKKKAQIQGRSDDTTRRLTGLDNWGTSRARNTIASGTSMLAGLIESKASYGEVPRHGNFQTTAIDTIQDPSSLIHKAAAYDVEYGKKYRENVNIYEKFYSVKSIQPSNNFTVRFGWGDSSQFDDNGNRITNDTTESKSMKELYGNMPKIEAWHVKNVTVSVLPTPINVQKSFTYAFPTIDVQSMEHKFTVTLQEDKIGTVFNFIQWAYSRIISPSGIHYSQLNNRIGWCKVSVLNPYTLVLTEFLYQDVFIIGANQLSLDYSNSGIIEYTVDFMASSRIVKTIDLKRKTDNDIDIDKFNSGSNIGYFESMADNYK